ncbi:unnamed protein product, partial [Amoebophrya sp. A120]
ILIKPIGKREHVEGKAQVVPVPHYCVSRLFYCSTLLECTAADLLLFSSVVLLHWVLVVLPVEALL